MNKHAQALSNDASALAEDARALMATTAAAAGDKVSGAGIRLTAALESSKALYGRVHDKAVERAKVAGQAVHEHPYQAIGIGLGIGLLIGYILALRCSRNGNGARYRIDDVRPEATGRRLEASRA